jgi:hypothetical protein
VHRRKIACICFLTSVSHGRAKVLILGKQGSFATIVICRIDGDNLRSRRVMLMRGAADFISLYERLAALEQSQPSDGQINSPGSMPHQPPPMQMEQEAPLEKLLRENALLRQAPRPRSLSPPAALSLLSSQ